MILVLDNARYHHAKLHKEWRKKNAAEFKIEYLPPYSPELNMIERTWKLTRRRCLHNQYFPSLKSVAASVEELFISWRKPNETLRKLCAIIYDAVYSIATSLKGRLALQRIAQTMTDDNSKGKQEVIAYVLQISDAIMKERENNILEENNNF